MVYKKGSQSKKAILFAKSGLSSLDVCLMLPFLNAIFKFFVSITNDLSCDVINSRSKIRPGVNEAFTKMVRTALGSVLFAYQIN